MFSSFEAGAEALRDAAQSGVAPDVAGDEDRSTPQPVQAVGKKVEVVEFFQMGCMEPTGFSSHSSVDRT